MIVIALSSVRRPRFLLVVVILIAGSPSAWSYEFRPTELHFHLSAAYCKARFAAPDLHDLSNSYVRVPPAEIRRWQKMTGDIWRHMHHYCYGAVLLTEALGSGNGDTNVSPSRRRALLQGKFERAANEMQYTISKDSDRNPLWGVMRIKQARAYEGAGNRKRALGLLAAVAKRQPENDEVYVAIAQTYARSGDLLSAIDALEAGARVAKNKKAIYFYLAQYSFDSGNIEQARLFTEQAESEGLEMTRMRQRLESSQSSGER